MEIKCYKKLPEEAKAIRKAVFVDEQGFEEEFDGIDASAVHLVALEAGKPAATCRFYWDRLKKAYVLGRLAVLAPYRGKKIGECLMREAQAQVDAAGGKALYLHAQCRASGFYEKQGYRNTGTPDMVEGCPHTWMYKTWG